MQDPTGPKVASLAGLYKKRFGRALTPPWFVATGYDGVQLIVHCMRTAGTTPQLIRDCIATTKGFDGITQTFSFTPGGSSPQFSTMFQIKGGKASVCSRE